jgi:hypothetical protein
MIDLLTKAGIPSFAALALVICAAIIWRYFNHRLEMQRKQFEGELSLIQSVHRDRFDAVYAIYRHLSELFHNLNNLHHPKEKEDRKQAIQRHVIALRSLVREKALILGDSIQPKVYAVTDFASSVKEEEFPFDSDRWFELEDKLRSECQTVLKTIPRIGYELKRVPRRNQNAEQPREPGA